MKLLFDQNLSYKLAKRLQDIFPGSLHVNEISLDTASDAMIWEYAQREGFAIVSKDSDFLQRSFIQENPPKVVWITLGNCATTAVERLLRDRKGEILDFGKNEVEVLLALG